MTDDPYEEIERLPASAPTLPDTLHLNILAPERPQPRTGQEEVSSHFPLEFPPKNNADKESFPGKQSASS